MKSIASFFTALTLVGLTAYAQDRKPTLVAQDGRQQLKGHLTKEMMEAPLASRVAPTTHLTLTVGLVIPNRDKLAEAAAQIADPNSPSYRHYLTPEQFADAFGASQADYQAVVDWAKANHLEPTTHRNRFIVGIEGAVADIEPALNLHLSYRLRPDGTQFIAPDAEPSLKLSIPVEHISGLDNFFRPQRAAGSAPDGEYQGTDFRNAYAPNMTPLTGLGQKIGIFMGDGFAQSDIDGYAAQTNQTFLPVQVVPANATLTPGGEGTLDVEAALSVAPGAQVIAFVGNFTDILAYMADYPAVKQLSSSWFWYNGDQNDATLMLQMSMLGQSFFQASGDWGAYKNPLTWPNQTNAYPDNRLFPAITIVGGTVLNMTGNGATYDGETAWPYSGGGFFTTLPLPSYQLGIVGSNGASDIHRNAPDVSAQAQDILYYFNGVSSGIGGTSLATPLFAGFMALVNELAENAHQPSVGFANPALYQIASTSAYKQNFNDITSGCNPASDGTTYCAGQGYDLVTGLGSPRNQLIYSLSGIQAYPLYCQGPLRTSGNPSVTLFTWASKGAGAAKPGPGQCAWADRGPSGNEIQAGHGNEIVGPLGQEANLPAGKFAEFGVYNDPDNHWMKVTQVVGLVKPPFSSNPTLP